MCGINGFLKFRQRLTRDEIYQLINKMNDSIVHRGPDDEGVYVDNNAGLGMRRLSIIDLATGSQPIFNEDKSLVIVLNGEIYNYLELKKVLVAKGHHFYTESDTEVALHSYEEYGVDCFKRFDGMFALAIYNPSNGELLIARDRSGEKPLHYAINDRCFIFGSELKSLLSTGLIDRSIDRMAFNQYLQLTYIPSPLTILSAVKKVKAGHYLQVTADGRTQETQYWEADDGIRQFGIIDDYDECKRMLRKALFATVAREMISDVPLGAFLSGGIDSSIIVGIMSQISSKPINTFTIGFRDKAYDESARAALVAKHHNTCHHLHYLEADEVLAELDEILQSIDEPFGDSSVIPTYFVSKHAHQHVKVALTGDAGDELFAGYSKYQIGRYARIYRNLPSFAKAIIAGCAYTIPDRTPLSRKIKKVINNSEKDAFSQHRNLMCLGFKENELQQLIQQNYYDESSLQLIEDYYNRFFKSDDELCRVLLTDFKVVLEGDMLHKVDRMSMLNSLETRTPLLGKEVLDVTSRIPSRYKMNGAMQKIILKETFQDLLPSRILTASKNGFGIPLGKWLQGPFKCYVDQYLSEDYIQDQGIFNFQYIKTVLDEHMANKNNRFSEIWNLLVFQIVYNKYCYQS